MSYFKGSGTPTSPFAGKVRDILRVLIANPRASLADIKRQLEGRTPNIGGLHSSDLETGEFSQAVSYRVAIRPLRYPEESNHPKGAGACLVHVKLHTDSAEARAEFESEIQKVAGVIGWDLVSGGDFDYLVRVAGRVGDERAVQAIGTESKSSDRGPGLDE